MQDRGCVDAAIFLGKIKGSFENDPVGFEVEIFCYEGFRSREDALLVLENGRQNRALCFEVVRQRALQRNVGEALTMLGNPPLIPAPGWATFHQGHEPCLMLEKPLDPADVAVLLGDLEAPCNARSEALKLIPVVFCFEML